MLLHKQNEVTVLDAPRTLPEEIYSALSHSIPAIARRVKRRCPMTVETEDLEQVGRGALWQVCAALESYAKMRIRGAMLDSIRGTEFREAARERDAVRTDELHSDPPSGSGSATSWRPEAADPFLTRAIARLGGRQADVIELRFRMGCSRPEAGERIGISPHAVGRAERAAIKALRGVLKAA
ncbi:MAG TPA: sigma-70 family RNA polymerase sigma factor [Bryobacteraceae bacterium]|jgi:RNA polymerase sigma factor (sigma-70 family)|nr:sigma-70 family RNA polymerase sigma factor [Bryobacteraceae bacterium]